MDIHADGSKVPTEVKAKQIVKDLAYGIDLSESKITTIRKLQSMYASTPLYLDLSSTDSMSLSMEPESPNDASLTFVCPGHLLKQTLIKILGINTCVDMPGGRRKIFRIAPLSHYIYPSLKAVTATIEPIGQTFAPKIDGRLHQMPISSLTASPMVNLRRGGFFTLARVPNVVKGFPYYRINVRFSNLESHNMVSEHEKDYLNAEHFRYTSITYQVKTETVNIDDYASLKYLMGGDGKPPVPAYVLLNKAIVELKWHLVPHRYLSDETFLKPDKILNRIGTVNVSGFLGFKRHTLLLTGYESEPVTSPLSGLADSSGILRSINGDKLWNIKFIFHYFEPPTDGLIYHFRYAVEHLKATLKVTLAQLNIADSPEVIQSLQAKAEAIRNKIDNLEGLTSYLSYGDAKLTGHNFFPARDGNFYPLVKLNDNLIFPASDFYRLFLSIQDDDDLSDIVLTFQP